VILFNVNNDQLLDTLL